MTTSKTPSGAGDRPEAGATRPAGTGGTRTETGATGAEAGATDTETGADHSAGPGAGLAHISAGERAERDRKSTRLNSSHVAISYAVFCLKKKTIHYVYANMYACSVL